MLTEYMKIMQSNTVKWFGHVKRMVGERMAMSVFHADLESNRGGWKP